MSDGMLRATDCRSRDMRWYAERHREFMDSIQPVLAAKTRFYSLRLPKIVVFEDHVETEYDFSADEKAYLALLDEQIAAIKRSIYGSALV